MNAIADQSPMQDEDIDVVQSIYSEEGEEVQDESEYTERRHMNNKSVVYAPRSRLDLLDQIPPK